MSLLVVTAYTISYGIPILLFGWGTSGLIVDWIIPERFKREPWK